MPVSCVPNLSPICIIASLEMPNHIIYTASEFEMVQVLKIKFEGTFQNRCASKQSQSVVEVKGGLSLPDRILLNTNAGIFEMQADHTNITTNFKSDRDYALVLPSCVSHVVSPAQSSVHVVTVLAFGEEQDQEKVFMALPEKGSYPCRVISGSVNGVTAQSFVILVMLKTPYADTFHLVRFEGAANIGNWTALFHFPTSLDILETEYDNWQNIESEFSAINSEASYMSLTGLSFTAVVCDSLFIWEILCSSGIDLILSARQSYTINPDGGISIHWLTSFPGNSTITVYTSSLFDGTFAFLTDNQEINKTKAVSGWVKPVQTKVQRLDSSVGNKLLTPDLHDQNGSFVLSIFFDSAGRLQQIIADERSETKCIYREEIPVGRIISRQIFTQKQDDNIRSYQKAKTNSTSCLQSLPSVHWDGGLIHGSTTLQEYYTRVSNTVRSNCSGVSQDKRQAVKDSLPDLIHLGRSEWYSFVFYLYLDYDFQVETSAHSWSLTHLQASLRVSDAKVLNMTSQRTELIPQKAVKYEMTIQDGGLRLPQYRSGEGLTPASLHIQIWNSGLSCITGYDSSASLQGSYVMTVLLGCPAGRRLVFDSEASKNASRKHFCSPFMAYHVFTFIEIFPVFKVLDLATGQISQFMKLWTEDCRRRTDLSIIMDYSPQEQTKYKLPSKLHGIFDLGVKIKTWLCGTQSPCADIVPNFPGNAEYYFKLEFSNRIVDADTSNCDFTIRFLIRVHGLPPGSFNPSSVIVLSCIGILATLILTFYLLKRQEAQAMETAEECDSCVMPSAPPV
ncbi:hypothetical protein OS493_028176 [Desmophyllum pertusum]|uniref:Uncharacterized protein n=1 Tax=Desmophyllum pertusum TaxID=174260 RepID=A0A9W9Z0M0_9CNID|nr:hypothetical protein OS493_028176 [Desmophyllum pertusum]